MTTYLKVILIIIAYFAIGAFIRGIMPTYEGEKMNSWILLWAICIPIVILAGIAKRISTVGERVGNACRKKFKKNK